jgi:phenylacetate-coenzyme A ligase PaaK-like adenylate-forming protein
MDELIVQAESSPEVDPGLVPKLKTKLETQLRTRGLRTSVQMMDPGTLERTEFKAKRVIDKRGLYDEMTKNV